MIYKSFVVHIIVLINLLQRHFKECPDGIGDYKKLRLAANSGSTT